MKRKSLSVKKKNLKSLIYHLNNKKICRIYKNFESYLNLNIDKNTFKIGIAISGGPDSMSLAFLTKCYLLQKGLFGKFFLVNHNLRKGSSVEAKKVKILLKKFNINCEVLNWNGKKPRSNIQATARKKRYDLLEMACKKNGINRLLLGHHIDDLYENFFIRILRGSGLKGIVSFSNSTIQLNKNIKILRPLINEKKKNLIYISKKVFNFYVKDPSNKNDLFQRSRMRKLIESLKKEGLDFNKLKLTINNLKESETALNYYADKNIHDNVRYLKNKSIYILNKNFFNSPEEVVFRSFSRVLKQVGQKYYPARGKSITLVLNKIRSKKNEKITLSGCIIEKFNNSVTICQEFK